MNQLKVLTYQQNIILSLRVSCYLEVLGLHSGPWCHLLPCQRGWIGLGEVQGEIWGEMGVQNFTFGTIVNFFVVGKLVDGW